MTTAPDAPPSLVPPVSLCRPTASKHYVYLLCFRAHPAEIKVGLSDCLGVRMRHFAAQAGPYDWDRCVAVATADRREAYLLEHTILAFFKYSRCPPPPLLADMDGHTEWLRVEAYSRVLAIIKEWGQCPPGRTRLVPILEAAGAAALEREPRATPSESAAERRQGVLQRKRAKEVERHRANRAKLDATCRAIEEHVASLRRVQLWTDHLGRLCGRLLFRGGGTDQPPSSDFDPAELATRLAINREIAVHRDVRWPTRWPLTRGHKIISPRASSRYGLIIRVRIELTMLNRAFNRETPEVDAFVGWLGALRAQVRKRRGGLGC